MRISHFFSKPLNDTIKQGHHTIVPPDRDIHYGLGKVSCFERLLFFFIHLSKIDETTTFVLPAFVYMYIDSSPKLMDVHPYESYAYRYKFNL